MVEIDKIDDRLSIAFDFERTITIEEEEEHRELRYQRYKKEYGDHTTREQIDVTPKAGDVVPCGASFQVPNTLDPLDVVLYKVKDEDPEALLQLVGGITNYLDEHRERLGSIFIELLEYTLNGINEVINDELTFDDAKRAYAKI